MGADASWAAPTARFASSIRVPDGSSTTRSRFTASVVRLGREAIAASRVRPAGIGAVGITNQRETFVVWERKSGRPVHRAIVWQCRRSAAICARARPARGRGPPAHRTADRSLLLRHQAQVAARQRPHAAPARCARRTVLRHDRFMADIPALARRGIRDRLHQRVAHHDAQSRAAADGTPRCSRCSACRPRCCRSRSARAVRWPRRPPAPSDRAPSR